MTAALGAPLAAAGLVATLCTAAGLVHPLAGMLASACVLAAAVPLAAVSVDRPRRILWTSLAATTAGVLLRAFVAPPDLPFAADPRIDALRATLAAPLRALVPEPESALLVGIVLGERAAIPRDLRDAFAATGTAHLLAISGSNMTLVAAATTAVLRPIAGPRTVAACSVIAVGLYAVLVGLGPSVVRAALMAAVASLGIALGRRGMATNALGGAVAAMLIADPRALEDVGFQLSVAATAGLIAWQVPIAAHLGSLARPIRDGLAATIAASTPTIPIVAGTFGRVSIVSPLANLIAVPLFSPIMVFGAAAATVGAAIPIATWPLALTAFVFTAALRHVVEVAAAVPFASIAVPEGPLTALAVTAALVAAWRLRGNVRDLAERAGRIHPPREMATTRARLLVGAGTMAFVVSAAFACGSARGSSFRVHALDVGQGDAYLIESNGHWALIDGGPDGPLLLRRLGEVLPPWHRRIDLIALTHEHADHGAGLLALLERYEVGLAIEPAGMGAVPLAQMWSERIARARVARRAVADGAVIRVGGVTLRVLAPGRDRRLAVPDLVIRATRGDASVLFMGDATDDAIADLLLAPGALASRVYVPPHHGAETPYARALVAAVRPEVAVISVGAMNRYGHPAPDTLAALDGIAVYRTDRYGTVDLALDAEPLAVHTTKAAVPPDRGGSVPRASPAR